MDWPSWSEITAVIAIGLTGLSLWLGHRDRSSTLRDRQYAAKLDIYFRVSDILSDIQHAVLKTGGQAGGQAGATVAELLRDFDKLTGRLQVLSTNKVMLALLAFSKLCKPSNASYTDQESDRLLKARGAACQAMREDLGVERLSKELERLVGG